MKRRSKSDELRRLRPRSIAASLRMEAGFGSPLFLTGAMAIFAETLRRWGWRCAALLVSRRTRGRRPSKGRQIRFVVPTLGERSSADKKIFQLRARVWNIFRNEFCFPIFSTHWRR